MIDINAMVGYWPFNRLPARTPTEMETYLRAAGFTQACVYAPEAVFYADPQIANEELFLSLPDTGFFVPSAVVDPTLPNCEELLVKLRDKWHVPLLRLFPNYHSYSLADPEAEQLLAMAAKLDIAVAVHMRMCDERSHHRLMKVPAVPIQEVITAADAYPGTRLLLCCPMAREIQLFFTRIVSQPYRYAEISCAEGLCSVIENLLAYTTYDKLLLGTHAPLYYPQAAVAKVEDARHCIEDAQVAAIAGGNAHTLLPRAFCTAKGE